MDVGWLEVVVDPVRLGILRSLSRVPNATTADLAWEGQASSQTLRRHLESLVLLGVIEEHAPQSDGQTPGRPATRYSMPARTRESVRSLLKPEGIATDRSQGPPAQAAGSPSPVTLASTNLTAGPGPMNGASAR